MNIDAKVLRCAGCCLALLLCVVEAVNATEPAEPVVLVASDRPVGPGYRETVVFAAPVRAGYHIGFILNRPTPAKLGDLFPEHAPSRKVVDHVYLGGPVRPEALFAIARRAPGGSDVIELMPGLVLAMDATTIDKMIETMPNDARYFAGLVIWQPGELDEEIRAGGWEVRPAEPGTVLRSRPEQLWKDLHTGRAGKRFRVLAPLGDLPLASLGSR
jgi:putative transcriptional regulator